MLNSRVSHQTRAEVVLKADLDSCRVPKSSVMTIRVDSRSRASKIEELAVQEC